MSNEQLLAKIAQLEQELLQARSTESTLSDLLEKKLNELYIHYHISRTIGSLPDLRDMLGKVTEIIQKSISFERISVYLLDKNKVSLRLAYSSGLDIVQTITLLLGEGTPGRIAQHGEHIHIHDLEIFYKTFNDFIHYPGEQKHGGSYIGIVLKAYNETIGVIGMDTSVKFGLSVDDMDFMAILSHQLAAGIEKTLLFDKIQHLSQHDGLTDLYNYRVFQEKLQQEIVRRDRSQKPLSLMMLDIDNFKQINDTYGHQAGDDILKELAGILSNQSRSHSFDICCRYGGEEFAVIMPELDLPNAIIAAERIRKTVDDYDFILKDQKAPVKLTVSLGVATLAGENDQVAEALVKKADDALYLSKRMGKNRVSSDQQNRIDIPSPAKI
jgi:diguanylate cyclase (GGDEF)-like protein